MFGRALRYPFNSKIFLLIFIVNLATALPSWFYITSLGLESINTVGGLMNFFFLMIPIWVVNFLIFVFLIGLYYHNASKFFSRGKHAGLEKSFDRAKERYIPLLGTMVLLMVIFGLGFFIFGGFGIFMASTSMVYVLGVFPGIIAVIVLTFYLFLAPPITVIEKAGPLESLKRSFSLLKKNKLNTFAFFVILAILAYIISLIGMAPMWIYQISTRNMLLTTSTWMLPFIIVQLFFGTYVSLLSYSSQVNYYSLLKGGKEKAN